MYSRFQSDLFPNIKIVTNTVTNAIQFGGFKNSDWVKSRTTTSSGFMQLLSFKWAYIKNIKSMNHKVKYMIMITRPLIAYVK